MSLTSLFDKIAGKQKQRERARAGSFLELVHAIADGKEPDADRIDAILRECSKSLDELKQAVDRYLQRLEWRRQIDVAAAMTMERPAIEQKIAAANKALEEAEDKHAKVTNPLYARLQEIQDAVRTGDQARRQLWDTCLDGELLAQIAETTAALQAATKKRTDLAMRLLDEQVAERKACEAMTRTPDERKAGELREHAERHQTNALQIERQMAEITKQIRGFEGRLSALQEQMLEP